MNLKSTHILLIALWLLLVSSASLAEQLVKPKISIDQAISSAREYVKKNRFDISRHYLGSAQYSLFYPKEPEKKSPGWRILWLISEYVDGGEVIVYVYEDGSIVHFIGR